MKETASLGMLVSTFMSVVLKVQATWGNHSAESSAKSDTKVLPRLDLHSFFFFF